MSRHLEEVELAETAKKFGVTSEEAEAILAESVPFLAESTRRNLTSVIEEDTDNPRKYSLAG